MDHSQEHLSLIIQILSDHPEGRMMKDLAQALQMNRNAMAKYMAILFQQGKVDIRHIGKAKIFTLSKRIPFTILTEISSDYIIGIDRNLHCVDANTPFYTWAGCTPTELLGKPLRNLPGPLFQRSLIVDLARSGISSVSEPVKISCSLQNTDYVYEIRSIPAVFSDYTTGSAILIKDITYSETAAKKISLLEERYRALISAQSEYIVHSSPDGTILSANPAFAGLAGIPPEHLAGKKNLLEIPKEDRIRLKGHFRSIHPDNPEKCIEHRILASSGEFQWIRWNNRGIFREGALIEYHSHGTDITDLKVALNRLRYYHENTEKMIREKTDEFLRINRDLLREIQKRKEIEQNLQRTQFCINNSSEMILWTDESGAITSSNKSALNILGLQPGATPGFMRPGIAGPQKTLPWQETWESVKQNGVILFEAIMRDRSDKPLHMEVLGNFLFFDDRESCCLFIRDITARKTAENALLLVKKSVDSAYDEVFWMDVTANILYANDAACRTTGYSQEELCAMNIFSLDPDFTPQVWERSIEGLRKNKKQIFQSRHRCKNGVIIDVEIGLVYITQGEKEYVFCFVRDITGRRQMEMALRESEELFATAFYHGPLILSISDIDTGRYLDVNELFTRISGYSRDEVIGKTSRDHAWIDPVEWEKLNRELRRSGRVAGREIRCTKKGGEPVWCRFFWEKITVAGKERLLSQAEDITDRKLAEAALHKNEEKYKRFFESFVDVCGE
jgi:PAS domain S-box-containing protein